MVTCPLLPLTAEAFAPYGEVFVPETVAGRIDHVAALDNRRPAARPNLFLARSGSATLPHGFSRMESHPDSSQTFLPLEKTPVLVVVALPGSDGQPDLGTLGAFMSRGQGFSYRAGVWHLPLTAVGDGVPVLGFMYEDGSPRDTVWAEVPQTVLAAG